MQHRYNGLPACLEMKLEKKYASYFVNSDNFTSKASLLFPMFRSFVMNWFRLSTMRHNTMCHLSLFWQTSWTKQSSRNLFFFFCFRLNIVFSLYPFFPCFAPGTICINLWATNVLQGKTSKLIDVKVLREKTTVFNSRYQIRWKAYPSSSVEENSNPSQPSSTHMKIRTKGTSELTFVNTRWKPVKVYLKHFSRSASSTLQLRGPYDATLTCAFALLVKRVQKKWDYF